MVQGVMPKQFFIESFTPAVRCSLSLASETKDVGAFVGVAQIVPGIHQANARHHESRIGLATAREVSVLKLHAGGRASEIFRLPAGRDHELLEHLCANRRALKQTNAPGSCIAERRNQRSDYIRMHPVG